VGFVEGGFVEGYSSSAFCPYKIYTCWVEQALFQ